jgi:ribose-phosphate pyrophosphokinase
MELFLTSSTRHLYRSFLRSGCDMGHYDSYVFADGERGYRLKTSVKGKSAGIIGSILPSPESLFELLALNRLSLENGAARTTLIVPYLGYARQDRPCRPGEGSIGMMVAELIRNTKPSKLFLIDVHSDRIRKVLRQAATEISALPLFANALGKEVPDVIVSPDAGSIARAGQLASLLKPRPQVATIDKVRPYPNVAVAKRLHGEVRGKKVVIVDDIIDTGGTLTEAVKLVSQNGSRSIRLCATHGIFSGDARDRLSLLPVKEILVTNTLHPIRHPKIRVLDIVPVILKKLRQT